MKSPSNIRFLYFIFMCICVLLLFGFYGALNTLTNQQASKAAGLESSPGNSSLFIHKLKNKQPVTIVTYGDSITWGYERDAINGKVRQVKNPYPKVLEKQLRKKFGYHHITVINEGHPGWTSIQAVENIEKDVLRYQPDLVITMFGINDARGHKKYSPNAVPVPVEQYQENNRQLLQELKENEIEVVIISSTAITSQKNLAHITQTDYTNAIKSLALEENVEFLNGSDIPVKGLLSDEVHFKAQHYEIIAEKIMRDVFSTS